MDLPGPLLHPAGTGHSHAEHSGFLVLWDICQQSVQARHKPNRFPWIFVLPVGLSWTFDGVDMGPVTLNVVCKVVVL